jgi:hypothetical protein
MRKDPLNLDANESVTFSRELEHIKSQTYDTKYKQLKAKQVIPVDSSAPSGAKTITYRTFSKVGVAKIVSDYANDFPRADAFGVEKSANVRSVGDSYGYSIQEIRESQMSGSRLDQRRAESARRASEQLVDNIAWNGDTDNGLQGLINYPGINEYTVPADGTGSSKLWSTKTPDQIVRDITGMSTAVEDITNGMEVIDTLLLPIAQYNILKNTRMTDGNDKTIMTYLMENDIIASIEKIVEMKGAGAGGTDKMMGYVRSPQNLTLEIPQPFEQFPAQQKGMEFEVVCHQRTGGVIVYYPLSVVFGDGI